MTKHVVSIRDIDSLLLTSHPVVYRRQCYAWCLMMSFWFGLVSLAEGCVCFRGADLSALVREASVNALRVHLSSGPAHTHTGNSHTPRGHTHMHSGNTHT